MDSAIGLQNSKQKKEQVALLVQRFKDEVLSKPSRETLRRTVAKVKQEFTTNYLTTTSNEHQCKVNVRMCGSGKGITPPTHEFPGWGDPLVHVFNDPHLPPIDVHVFNDGVGL